MIGLKRHEGRNIMGAMVQEPCCCGRSRFVGCDKPSHRPSAADLDPRFFRALETEDAVPKATIASCTVRHLLRVMSPMHRT
jgi:hypothetical protein